MVDFSQYAGKSGDHAQVLFEDMRVSEACAGLDLNFVLEVLRPSGPVPEELRRAQSANDHCSADLRRSEVYLQRQQIGYSFLVLCKRRFRHFSLLWSASLSSRVSREVKKLDKQSSSLRYACSDHGYNADSSMFQC